MHYLSGKMYFISGLADVVLVNSKFTAETFRSTFTSLYTLKPTILYPSLNFHAFDASKLSKEMTMKDLWPPHAEYIFLSINRFERKKKLALALNAMSKLKEECSSDVWKKIHLVIAGKCIYLFILLCCVLLKRFQ